MTDERKVAEHYATDDIAGRILAALRGRLGADARPTPDALAPIDHFHGGGLGATRQLVALLTPQRGDKVLDIGSGIGGPARWIASNFDCHVTGIDLTTDFCRAAEALNALTGLTDKVRIVEGSALELPFEPASFDRAYSQNVVMNIADKPRFYGEALRVLKPGGVLALSNLAAGSGGAPHYPVPWAASAATSFLSTLEATRTELVQAGFEVVRFDDLTEKSIADRKAMQAKLAAGGPPPLDPEVFMGKRMADYRRNVMRSMDEGRLLSIEVLARRPL